MSALAPARLNVTLDPAALGGFRGVRAIADIHGSFDAFDAALRAAEAERRFVVQLGDLIDRGPYSPLCVERMLDLEDEGKGLFLLGNHEVAFARLVRSGAGGAVTRQATLMQFEEHGGGLVERFVARIERGPLWVRAGEHLLAHAAFHPCMLTNRVPDGLDVVGIATHGYGTSIERRSGLRAREWVDAIPPGLTVVVGHAVTASKAVEAVTGRRGGKAVFADTGAWIDGAGFPFVDIDLA